MPAAGVADLIFATSHDANMLYATRFEAHDPFLYIGVRGRRMIAVSRLEVDRAKKQAEVDRVISLADYEEKLKAGRAKAPPYHEVARVILRDLKIRRADVPPSFPVGLADDLRRGGVRIRVRPEPFLPARTVKSVEEVRHIATAVRLTEQALELGIGMIARASIRSGRLRLGGQVLTAEMVRSTMAEWLLSRNMLALDTIVAGGDQACDPHDRGSGPLPAHQAIVIDIFPRSIQSGYWADMTRTVVRGKPSPALQRLYDTVLDAQQQGVRAVRAGTRGSDVHRTVEQVFERAGYKTEKQRGRWVGFFHGTGHGVGLDLHELPRVSKADNVLKRGEVVTVEPGLYYPGLGGVRIEDLVLVQERGRRNFNRFHKRFVV